MSNSILSKFSLFKHEATKPKLTSEPELKQVKAKPEAKNAKFEEPSNYARRGNFFNKENIVTAQAKPKITLGVSTEAALEYLNTLEPKELASQKHLLKLIKKCNILHPIANLFNKHFPSIKAKSAEHPIASLSIELDVATRELANTINLSTNTETSISPRIAGLISQFNRLEKFAQQALDVVKQDPKSKREEIKALLSDVKELLAELKSLSAVKATEMSIEAEDFEEKSSVRARIS